MDPVSVLQSTIGLGTSITIVLGVRREPHQPILFPPSYCQLIRLLAERAVMNLVQRFAARKTLDTLATGLSAMRVGRAPPAPAAAKAPAWIFLGPPGVGKGTYSSRVASALGVPHVAAGDLVREQIKNKTEFGIKVSTSLRFSIYSAGQPLPRKDAAGRLPV